MPLGFYSLRYRDFLVETIPGGERLGDYIDEYELHQGGTTTGKAGNESKRVEGSSTTELTRYAETKAKASGWELKPAAVTEKVVVSPKEEKKDSVSAVAKHRAETAARKTKGEAVKLAAQAKTMEDSIVTKAERVQEIVEKRVESVVEETKTLVDEATTMIAEAASSIPSAVAAAVVAVEEYINPTPEPPTPEPTPAVTVASSNRPRELDATPIPKKRANNETYTGPPLPVGFEPPIGYELRRAPPTPKGELQPLPIPPLPLPLVAPAVQDLASSEPILGQLATTIDTLAQFVANNTDAESSSPSTVLKTAEADIQKLAERLEAIKAGENAKLEASLSKQASEYSGLLLAAEKELVERLDTQEEDWKKAFDDERRTLVEAYKMKLDNELATQQEIINARLKEEVVAQGIEMQRRWVREIKVRVEQERGGRLAKLEELEGGIRKLEKVTKENEEIIGESVRARKVWTALKAVEHKVETGAPFDDELRALQRLVTVDAAVDNHLISIALANVSPEVAATGITSFSTLAARFTSSVSPQLRRVALLPENTGVFSYLTSYLLSSLLFTKNGWAEGDDVISIIARAEWYLTNRDLESATKEINSLQGWPKRLAKDWLNEARKHLETKQALEVM